MLAGNLPVLVHNAGGDSAKGRIVNQSGIRIVIYSNDHGPPHAHVYGGGKDTKIGQNGKPVKGSPELTSKQRDVVEANLSHIRKSIRSDMAQHRQNTDGCK
ncbi:DUF4160 domain-containing protein [Streptomyces sp. NPDC050433]|uniref:DUF4160 domain-containing protein n=1 Tax=unclassified Streptomyces TaxID=2593676 RepID=UPI003413A4D0